MRRRVIRSATLVMAIALCLLPWPALAANRAATVTGVGGSLFAAGSMFNGVTLTSYRFGLGILVASDGTATGDLETTLLGTYQSQPWIGSVVCKAAAGSVNPSGLVTFSGTCYIDMGAAAPPSSAAFTSTGKDKQNTLSLTVGSTTWQIATGTNGSITVILN
jgi:hypothetical protein